MIEFVNVDYIYDARLNNDKVLKDINLKIHDGLFTGIIGKTGSGKSTLIQMMNGLLQPTTGKILIDNEDINSDKKVRRELKFKVGMVFQYPEYQLFANDIISDVMYGPINMGLTKKAAEERARDSLSLLGIPEDKFSSSPFDLSGGEKKRVALAGILAMNPNVLVLDEPTAGLDPEGRRNLFTILKSLQKEKKMTLIVVSHSMEDMAEYADRLVVMNDGRIFMDDMTVKVFSEYKKLETIGLSAPEIMIIMNEMKKRGIDADTSIITMEEAVKCLEKLL